MCSTSFGDLLAPSLAHARGPVSAIELEVIKHRIGSIADEMAIAMIRTAYSSIVRDTLDFSIDSSIRRNQRSKLRVETRNTCVEPTYLHQDSTAAVAASMRAINGISSSRRTFSADWLTISRAEMGATSSTSTTRGGASRERATRVSAETS